MFLVKYDDFVFFGGARVGVGRGLIIEKDSQVTSHYIFCKSNMPTFNAIFDVGVIPSSVLHIFFLELPHIAPVPKPNLRLSRKGIEYTTNYHRIALLSYLA